ncbi:uncharacterized protein BDV17DRAFT_286238 [Aspergillus undulatus]|uniref:uncharacterized protein n=1 Tax=Aspergillus undulatus TaxID=1810928 RepID=UPI003CCCCAC1
MAPKPTPSGIPGFENYLSDTSPAQSPRIKIEGYGSDNYLYETHPAEMLVEESDCGRPIKRSESVDLLNVPLADASPSNIMGLNGGAPNASATESPPYNIEESERDRLVETPSGEQSALRTERSTSDRMPRYTSEETTPGLITEIEGDLFDARDGAALIHACNCHGVWGSGIAKTFKQKYPAAFNAYKDYCQKYKSKKPVLVDVDVPAEAVSSSSGRKPHQPRTQIQLPEGTALLIKPQKEDYDKEPQRRKHWIICLFTSRGYGNKKNSVEKILQSTELAVANLEEQLAVQRSKELESEDIGITELRSCRLNSGLFGVEWACTKKILEDSSLTITVVRPPGEPLEKSD